MTNNIVYQDNQIEIRMENNGSNSCTGNSRNINIRYFFVRDRLYKGKVKIEYCPTQMMLADYLQNRSRERCTKCFRDIIMGYKPISSLKPIPVSIKEHVGNNKENV